MYLMQCNMCYVRHIYYFLIYKLRVVTTWSSVKIIKAGPVTRDRISVTRDIKSWFKKWRTPASIGHIQSDEVLEMSS